MAEKLPELNVDITAKNETQSAIDQIKKELAGLVHQAEHVGHATEHMSHPHVFAELTEHVDILKEHFTGLRGSIGEVGMSVTELLPALAALGAAGSLVALFETAEHVAEAYGELAHTAESLGMEAQQLHELQIVAKLTDTNVEGMGKSIGRLNKVLGETVAGKNKDAAALFSHLHLNPRSFKDGADALPALANAFEHTKDATVRARMAFVLFGRAGVDMIPLLMKGGDALREKTKDAARLGIDFAPYAEGLEHYNEAQKSLNVSVQGFTDLLGGKLAPVLAPLVEEATDFVLANREWITGDIAGGVREFSGYLKEVPWREVEDDIRAASKEAGEFVTAIGGPKVAIEVLAGVMVLKGVLFLAEPIREAAALAKSVGELAIKLVTELVPAWGKVGTAAAEAGAAEGVAAEVHALKPGPAVAAGAGQIAHEAEDAGAAAAVSGSFARNAGRVAKAMPVIGTGVVIASEVAPVLDQLAHNFDASHPWSANLDHEFFSALDGDGKVHEPTHRGGQAGGHRDYGTPGTGRQPVHANPDAPGVGTMVDHITDYLPRPAWNAHPGYSFLDHTLPQVAPRAGGFAMPQTLPQVPSASDRPAPDPAKTDITIRVLGLPGQTMIDTVNTGPIGNVDVKNLGQAWNPF